MFGRTNYNEEWHRGQIKFYIADRVAFDNRLELEDLYFPRLDDSRKDPDVRVPKRKGGAYIFTYDESRGGLIIRDERTGRKIKIKKPTYHNDGNIPKIGMKIADEWALKHADEEEKFLLMYKPEITSSYIPRENRRVTSMSDNL